MKSNYITIIPKQLNATKHPNLRFYFMKFIFSLISILTTACLQAQTAELYYVSKTPFKGLEQLDSIAKDYTIFFTGENHNYAIENNNIQLKMLSYLNKTAGVQHYIIELGYARGYMLNAYINNDTAFYPELQATTATPYLAFYKALRALNNGLPLEKKIQVHGVDVERFADDAPILLGKLLPKNRPVPNEIEFEIEVIKSYADFSKNRYNYDRYYGYDGYQSDYEYYGFQDMTTIDTILKSYEYNKPYFKTYLKDSFPIYDKVFQSLAEYRKWQNYTQMPHQSIYRERVIYNNIAHLIKQDSNAKFYGEFGRCHTGLRAADVQCNWFNVSPTVKRLNEGIAKGKTLNIGIFYNTDRWEEFENDSINDVLKKYTGITCSDENILVKIKPSDSLFGQYFPFILVNNTCSDWKGNRKKSYHDMAEMIDFGYGQSHFDFSKFNQKMQFINSGFNDILTNYNITYAGCDDGFYRFCRFEQNTSQRISQNNIRYKLKGYNTQWGFGYQPRISTHFNIGISGIFAFQRFSLLMTNDSIGSATVPGFSAIKKYKYVNNAFSTGIGIDFRIALTPWLGIFVRGRYLVDLSLKTWRNKAGGYGYLDKASPPLSLTNYSIQTGITFMVRE